MSERRVSGQMRGFLMRYTADARGYRAVMIDKNGVITYLREGRVSEVSAIPEEFVRLFEMSRQDEV